MGNTRTQVILRECKRSQAREKEPTERGGKKIYAIESVHGYKSVIVQITLPPRLRSLLSEEKARLFALVFNEDL